MAAAAPASRRFYFTLRKLFVVVTISGVLLGWLGVQLKWIHDRNEALRWIADYRSRQLAAQRGTTLPPLKGEYLTDSGNNAPWSLRIFGESGIQRIEVYQDWLKSDARYSLHELRSLFPEAEVIAVAGRASRASSNQQRIREEVVNWSATMHAHANPAPCLMTGAEHQPSSVSGGREDDIRRAPGALKPRPATRRSSMSGIFGPSS